MISMTDIDFHRVQKITFKSGDETEERKGGWIYFVLHTADYQQEITVFFDTAENRLRFLEQLRTGNIEIREGV